MTALTIFLLTIFLLYRNQHIGVVYVLETNELSIKKRGKTIKTIPYESIKHIRYFKDNTYTVVLQCTGFLRSPAYLHPEIKPSKFKDIIDKLMQNE